MPETKDVKKELPKSNPIKDYFRNLRNLKTNFNTVRNNPYAFNKFQFYLIRGVLALVALMVTWNLGKMLFSHSAGSNPMSMVVKAIVLIIMVIFLSKLWTMYKVYKKNLTQYNNPETIKTANYANEKKLDVTKEIDELLSQYDDSGKKKEKEDE